MLEQFHQQTRQQRWHDPTAAMLCSDQTGVLLLGHGSRRAEANEEWEMIWQMFCQLHPQLTVQRAYVEFCHPSLEEGVALLAGQKPLKTIVIVPLFLTTGKLPWIIIFLIQKTNSVKKLLRFLFHFFFISFLYFHWCQKKII